MTGLHAGMWRGGRVAGCGRVWLLLGLSSAALAAEAQPGSGAPAAAAATEAVRPRTAAEIVPAAPAAEENAAPLLMEAIAALETENVWDTTLAGLAAEAYSSGYGAPTGRNLVGLVESLHIPAEGKRSPTVDEVCEEFARRLEGAAARRALALCTQATARSRCWFPLDYSKGAEMLLPHLSKLRNLARFLAATSCVLAEHGDSPTAWELVIQQLRLADLLREDPILISQLVRIAVLRMAVSTLQDVTALAPPGADRLRQLDALLDRLDDAEPMATALEGERLFLGDWIFAQPLEKIRELLKTEGGVKEAPTLTAEQLAAEHAAYTAALVRLSELARRPYYSVRGDVAAIVSKTGGADTVVTKGILPALGTCCRKAADGQAVLRVARVGLRLKARRAAQGAYPAALDPGLLAGIPAEKQLDPFTGKALCYRQEGEGFVLYSVGLDGTDDGGKPGPRDAKQGFDTVWRAAH